MAKTNASIKKAARRVEAENQADRLARIMADRYGVSWGGLHPSERDKWRSQCEQLLVYIDSTAFRGFLPGQIREADDEH